jgi:uncharacterized membrane protein YdjX (TVP38/TMEM64 family)
VLAAFLTALFAVGLVLVADGTLTPSSARAWADRELREPVRDLGVLGPVLFVLAGACSSVVLFPGPVVAATSGLLFGTAVGVPTTIASSLCGAILAFALARRWAHDAVEELAPPRVQELRAWIGRRGFLAVLYARIAPGVPYNLVNYAAGLAPLRLRVFAGATLLGSAPRGFAYTALGGTLGDLGSPEGVIAVAVLVGMALLGVGLAARERRRRGSGEIPTAAGPGTGSSSRASRSEVRP